MLILGQQGLPGGPPKIASSHMQMTKAKPCVLYSHPCMYRTKFDFHRIHMYHRYVGGTNVENDTGLYYILRRAHRPMAYC